MIRVPEILSIAVVVSSLGGAGALAAPATETPKHATLAAKPTAAHHHAAAPTRFVRSHREHASRVAAASTVTNDDKPADPPAEALPPLPLSTLTGQELEVSLIASTYGDRDYLMVDKPMGRIILVKDGIPVFMGSALTGQSTAGSIARGGGVREIRTTDGAEGQSHAGRSVYRLSGLRSAYGHLFDINQIQGKDWAIAIHQVYLGIPAEHRAERLASPNESDKHITFGCINVSPDAIQVLMRELPKDHPTVLYVLPQDETMTATVLSQRTS